MNKISALCLALCCSFPAFGQGRLSGLYEGLITINGIYSEDGYKFEMFIQQEGSKVEGRSYIHLNDGQLLQMEIRGKVYYDRSIYLHELKFVPDEGSDLEPPFNRKYELLFERGLLETSLNGFWQEMRPESFDEGRHRGRVFLKKVKASKA